MNFINIDRGWTYRKCYLDNIGMLDIEGKEVNLPHDGMIETEVSKDAPAGVDSGFFEGLVASYTKFIDIPSEWEGESIGLKFDGVMMHSTVDINGYKISEHHYGYTPFYADITNYVSFSEPNRITINVNTGVQPSSRWYTGAGVIREVTLCHSPKVHLATDGIYVYTKEVSDNVAFLKAQIDVVNETTVNHIAEVKVELTEEATGKSVSTGTGTIQVNAGSAQTADISLKIVDPLIWDVDAPNLYKVTATVTDKGEYRTRLIKDANPSQDEDSTLFGVRTISVDVLRGLRINNKTVKLKGGCVHHDNGLMGAVSLYESEARKVRKLKEIGFNAIRTAHNPPSKALVEACDREGMYIFDEAFDAWGMTKRPGDLATYFEYMWQQELTAFVKRDRVHPSVIMWSTGNEIPERGGLNDGYTWATRLAREIKKYDTTRPVSNGVCSLWSGLDDYFARRMDLTQNAKNEENGISWEEITEPFTNGLDVVGYNYMEELYEKDHEMFPERVMLGSENFPREIGFRWPLVESLPYVIGDFTWTAWDYIGEAGIGKSVFVEPDDPLVKQGPWAIMPQGTSFYPWRLANDADYDITGYRKAQGSYRSVVWGSKETYVYTKHPKYFGKAEVIGMWGFTNITKCWNYAGFEGKPVEVTVFSNADEVEIIVNGKSVGRKKVSSERPLPGSVTFETVYDPGKLEAVSYKDGVEISRDFVMTSSKPAKISLKPEKEVLKADGHDVAYINIEITDEEGVLVTDSDIKLTACVEGVGTQAGFGSANPITEENYTDNEATVFNGRAMIIVRSGYESGAVTVNVKAIDAGLENSCKISIS